MKILLMGLAFFLVAGCATIQDIMQNINQNITEPSLTPEQIEELKEVRQRILNGEKSQLEIDRKIDEAVQQMVLTLKPKYRKRPVLGKHKLGFLEISDIDRRTVNEMHQYITEKTLTLSFLQPVIAQNFDLVERFLLKVIIQELHLEESTIIDQTLAKHLGKNYDVDVIETGVVTVSESFVDINLRIVETRCGRIVAVGSVKLPNNDATRRWLREKGGVGEGWPERR